MKVLLKRESDIENWKLNWKVKVVLKSESSIVKWKWYWKVKVISKSESGIEKWKWYWNVKVVLKSDSGIEKGNQHWNRGGVITPLTMIKVKISTRPPPNLIPYIIIRLFAQKTIYFWAKKGGARAILLFRVFRHFWPIGSHWETRNQPSKLMANESLSID